MDVTNLHGRRAVERWERLSAGDIFERLALGVPDDPALVAWEGAFADPANERLSFREADALAGRVANALLAEGLDRSDRVLLFCENSSEALVAKIGCAKAGLVAMALNPALAPDVVAALIDRCEPAFAIVDGELWPRLEPALAPSGRRPDVCIPIGGTIPGCRTFAEFVAPAPSSEPDVEIHADDIWDILCTSGTTALPKAAMLSHQYTHVVGNAYALSLTRGVRLECDARVATFLPVIYHISAHTLPFAAWLAGGAFVIGRGHDPGQQAAAITRERVTAVLAGNPAMVEALADAFERDPERLDPTSLRVIVYAWSQVAPRTVERLKALCGDELVLLEVFGQTESIACHRFWPDRWPEAHARDAPARNLVGVPCPVLGSIVADPAAAEPVPVADGEPGEVLYRSPGMTAGYFRDEAATREAFRGGWFHSGDSCVVGEDGVRTMVDRFKDIVKTGGENVSSLRVEAVAMQHPAVAKAAAVGLPHERWGEAVTLFAVPGADAVGDEADVIAFCRARLAAFEVPKRVVFVDALPETVGGKVLKFRLREAHAQLYEG